MPGFEFAYRVDGNGALRDYYPLAKNLTGAPSTAATPDTPGTLFKGDPVAFSTLGALTTSGAAVIRALLAEDKSENYEESTVRRGMLGISDAYAKTDSNGRLVSSTSNGGYQPKVAGMGALNPLDSNGHSQSPVIIATPGTVFKAKLTTAAASRTAYIALKGTHAGLTIPTTEGGNFTVDSTITGEGALFSIVDVDPRDSTYLTVFVSVVDEGLSPTGSYCQYLNQNAYTGQ